MDLEAQFDSCFVVLLFHCVLVIDHGLQQMDLHVHVDFCFHRNAKFLLVVVNCGRYHLLFSFLLYVKVSGKIAKSILF